MCDAGLNRVLPVSPSLIRIPCSFKTPVALPLVARVRHYTCNIQIQMAQHLVVNAMIYLVCV